jgi:hypothetical protein
MKLVALNDNVVVAIEQNGSINLEVEHTRIINAPDDAQLELGWTYTKPPFPESKAQLFYPMHPPADLVLEPCVVYAVDEQGNQYVVENPEETA